MRGEVTGAMGMRGKGTGGEGRIGEGIGVEGRGRKGIVVESQKIRKIVYATVHYGVFRVIGLLPRSTECGTRSGSTTEQNSI